MRFKDYFLTVSLYLFGATSIAQPGWVLKLEKAGIKIYTKKQDSCSVKAVKAACRITTSMTIIAAVLLDINNSKDWIYSTKRVSLLVQPSPAEVIYYSEVGLPWPINNRDFIVDLVISQDPITKVVTATSINKPNFLPRFKDVVRVEQSYSQWLIRPLPRGQLSVEFQLQFDPGGNVPVWLTNLFATTGPFYTFQKLREQVKKSEYKDINLPFIKD